MSAAGVVVGRSIRNAITNRTVDILQTLLPLHVKGPHEVQGKGEFHSSIDALLLQYSSDGALFNLVR